MSLQTTLTSQENEYNNPFDPEEGTDLPNIVLPVNVINQIHQASSQNLYYHLVAHVNGTPVTWLADSAAPVAMVGLAMAKRIFGKNVTFTPTKRMFSDFNRNPVDVLGYHYASIQAGNWRLENARIYVANADVTLVLGSECFKGLGIRLQQIGRPEELLTEPAKEEGEEASSVNAVEEEKKYDKKAIFHPDPDVNKLIHKYKKVFFFNSRVVDFEVPLKLFPGARISQHKGRVIPVALQAAVDKAIRRLIANGHWKKIDSCDPNSFISPACITVKKDKSVKLASDCTNLNENSETLQFQMPNMEDMINRASRTIAEKNGLPLMRTQLDLEYAFGQMPLSEFMKKHSVVAIQGGEMSGLYQIQTGYYGFKNMPAWLHSVLFGTIGAWCLLWLDDILRIERSTKKDHLATVEKILAALEEKGFKLNLKKCNFLIEGENEWLGHIISEEGIRPLNGKLEAIQNMAPPKTVKEVRSLCGSLQQLMKYIPRLTERIANIRKLLKKNEEIVWGKEQEREFEEIKKILGKRPILAHFDPAADTLITCDASRAGLGATLEQLDKTGERRVIAYASRFLNKSEANYPVGELELLALVWSLDHFKYYTYGRPITVITDHKNLLSVIRPNRGGKTHLSRMNRWIARLIPYDFRIQYSPGEYIGLADYLSRHSFLPEEPESAYDEEFVINAILPFSELALREQHSKRPIPPCENCSGCLAQAREKLGPAPSKQTNQPRNHFSHCTLANSLNVLAMFRNNLPNNLLNPANRAYAGRKQIPFKEGTTRKVEWRIHRTPQCETWDLLYPKLEFFEGQNLSDMHDWVIEEILCIAEQATGTATWELLESSSKCEDYTGTVEAVLNQQWDKIAREYRPWKNSLHTKNGFLFKDDEWIPPNNIRRWTLKMLHKDHQTADQMWQQSEGTNWPNKWPEMVKWVEDCPDCRQTGKPQQQQVYRFFDKNGRQFGQFERPMYYRPAKSNVCYACGQKCIAQQPQQAFQPGNYPEARSQDAPQQQQVKRMSDWDKARGNQSIEQALKNFRRDSYPLAEYGAAGGQVIPWGAQQPPALAYPSSYRTVSASTTRPSIKDSPASTPGQSPLKPLLNPQGANMGAESGQKGGKRKANWADIEDDEEDEYESSSDEAPPVDPTETVTTAVAIVPTTSSEQQRTGNQASSSKTSYQQRLDAFSGPTTSQQQTEAIGAEQAVKEKTNIPGARSYSLLSGGRRTETPPQSPNQASSSRTSQSPRTSKSPSKKAKEAKDAKDRSRNAPPLINFRIPVAMTDDEKRRCPYIDNVPRHKFKGTNKWIKRDEVDYWRAKGEEVVPVAHWTVQKGMGHKAKEWWEEQLRQRKEEEDARLRRQEQEFREIQEKRKQEMRKLKESVQKQDLTRRCPGEIGDFCTCLPNSDDRRYCSAFPQIPFETQTLQQGQKPTQLASSSSAPSGRTAPLTTQKKGEEEEKGEQEQEVVEILDDEEEEEENANDMTIVNDQEEIGAEGGQSPPSGVGTPQKGSVWKEGLRVSTRLPNSGPPDRYGEGVPFKRVVRSKTREGVFYIEGEDGWRYGPLNQDEVDRYMVEVRIARSSGKILVIADEELSEHLPPGDSPEKRSPTRSEIESFEALQLNTTDPDPMLNPNAFLDEKTSYKEAGTTENDTLED